jgi:hypothetical protein
MTKIQGKGKKKAIVAVARKLGVLLLTLMKNGTCYEVRHFNVGRAVKSAELLAAVKKPFAEALSAQQGREQSRGDFKPLLT